MIEAYKKYKEIGVAVLPVKATKAPAVSANWKNGFDESYFNGAYGIGVICGSLSGGLECMDFDNHFNDAKEVLATFMAIPDVKAIYDKYNLPIELTMNKGYHLLFRCSKNDGNRKLAQKINDKGRPDAIIETRGEGGYFVAAPTPGYRVIRNDIFSIPVISEMERAILIDNAISLNEYTEVKRTEYETGDRPGDLYNSNYESGVEMRSILRENGWVEISDGRWRRPGKKEGLSATLGKVAPNILFVFTSNAHPFEPMKAYSAFQILALLKFNGDFSKAAESLPKPERHVFETKSKMAESELEKILNGARISLNRKIDKPPTILSIKEADATRTTYKRMFTLGNFSCIIGKAKSKKTFFLTMITAAMIKGQNYDDKFSGSLPDNKRTILYFDTEQGDYDSHNTVKKINTISRGLSNFEAFNLRPFSPIERCQIIEYAFKIYGDRVGFCVIDGIADLATGINDEEEATRVATMLLRLTKINNCHISTVLHQNKNDNFATGHLGSSIMKKAEMLVSVTKNNQDSRYSEVNCDMARGVADFEKFSFMITDDGLPEVVSLEAIEAPRNYYSTDNNDAPF